MFSLYFFFFFSSRRRHTRFKCDWSSDVCSSDLCTRRVKILPLCFSLLVQRALTGQAWQVTAEKLTRITSSPRLCRPGHQCCERCPWGHRTCCCCQSTWKALPPYPLSCCHPPSCLRGPP